jgi:hypothetical protein
MERQFLRRQCGLPTSRLPQNSNRPMTAPRSHKSRSLGIRQTHDWARHARRLSPPAEDFIWARLCVRSEEGSVIDDGVFTTLSSTYSFRDLFEIAQTCMGPHAASKAFMDMEITSLDLVEGGLSFSGIQAQGTARRRISMDSEKSWRDHYTSRLLRHEIRASSITMVVNGRSARPSAKFVPISY